MANNRKVNENAEIKKENETTEKKVATGNTKKAVQKRSSSVAGKCQTKKGDVARANTANSKKNDNPKTTSKNAPKATSKNTDKTKSKDTAKTKKIEQQLQEQKSAEIQEKVAKEIKANKKVPSAELGKINMRVFQNILLAVVIMFYLNFTILGFFNIENAVFITDLKVFSIALLAVSIGIFEYAYKKDSGRHAIHGIEILILAFVTIALIYVNLMWADKFIYIVAIITYVFAIYYVAKSIIVYQRMKKEYFVGEMKEIIKK